MEILLLSMGCLGVCMYCKMKYVCGDFGLYEIFALVSRVE